MKPSRRALGRGAGCDRRSRGRAVRRAYQGQHWPEPRRSGAPVPCLLGPMTRQLPPCRPTVVLRVDALHDATWGALAHRLEPYSPKLIDEGTRGSILLIPSALSTPLIRRGSEGSQKPF